MDTLDNYLTEYILLSIDDFNSYFIAQEVCTRWHAVLKSHEGAKLTQFSTLSSHYPTIVNILPNGKFHGYCEVVSEKQSNYYLSSVNYSRGRKHGEELIQLYAGPASHSDYTTIDWIYGVKHGCKIQQFGNIRKCTPYVNDIKHGLKIHLYEDGKLQSRIPYENGKKHGIEYRWNMHGQLMHRITYINGKIHPVRESWYTNGRRHITEHFQHGKLHGSLILMHDNGQINIRVPYLFGIIHGVEKRWSRNGQLLHRHPYFKGQLHGITSEWYVDGTLKSRVTWFKGAKRGLEERCNSLGMMTISHHN